MANSLLDIMFADDTNLFLVEKRLCDLESVMNIELSKISKWIQVNKLSLNVGKTNFMLFSGRRQVPSIPNIKMNDVEIKCIRKSKFLGIIIDDKLTWIHHIDHVCKKISKSIGILYKLRPFLNTKYLINMYYCFVYPYLQYCNEVWGNAYAFHLNRLKVLQNRVIRIIGKVDKLDYTDPLFSAGYLYSKFKILKFSHISDYMIGQIMYKAFFRKLPQSVQSIFVKNDEIHSHSTRQSDDFHPPLPKTNLLKMSISFKGVHIWTFIRRRIDVNCTFSCFKSRLKNMYISM